MPVALLWLAAFLWLGLLGVALLLTVFVTVYYLNNKHWELIACYLLAALDLILLATAVYGASLIPCS